MLFFTGLPNVTAYYNMLFNPSLVNMMRSSFFANASNSFASSVNNVPASIFNQFPGNTASGMNQEKFLAQYAAALQLRQMMSAATTMASNDKTNEFQQKLASAMALEALGTNASGLDSLSLNALNYQKLLMNSTQLYQRSNNQQFFNKNKDVSSKLQSNVASSSASELVSSPMEASTPSTSSEMDFINKLEGTVHTALRKVQKKQLKARSRSSTPKTTRSKLIKSPTRSVEKQNVSKDVKESCASPLDLTLKSSSLASSTSPELKSVDTESHTGKFIGVKTASKKKFLAYTGNQPTKDPLQGLKDMLGSSKTFKSPSKKTTQSTKYVVPRNFEESTPSSSKANPLQEMLRIVNDTKKFAISRSQSLNFGKTNNNVPLNVSNQVSFSSSKCTNVYDDLVVAAKESKSSDPILGLKQLVHSKKLQSSVSTHLNSPVKNINVTASIKKPYKNSREKQDNPSNHQIEKNENKSSPTLRLNSPSSGE